MFHKKFTQKYKYQNTRRYLRLPAAWPIKCEQSAEEAGEQHVTSTEDVSAGGVSFPVHKRVEKGSRVEVEIHVPLLKRSIKASGKVVRCTATRGGGFELGIQFDRIDPRDQIALNESIEQFFSPKKRIRHHQTWHRKL